MVVVMAVIVAMIVVGFRGVGVAMGVVVMLDGVAARATRMRADQRDDAGQDGAEQRQEDDCLNHIPRPSPSSD
jgi:hypothetical protein